MKEFFKKNFIIVLAFILPVAFITIIALVTYLPSLFLSTNYNFIYSSCTNGRNYYSYECYNYLQKRYSVINNKLVVNDIISSQDLDNDSMTDINKNYTIRIFLHNTKKNESKEITLEEAQKFSLNNLLTSPDGVTISSHYDRNINSFYFPFGGGSSSYGYYLTKGKSRSKLNLINRDDRYYYRDNFQFIGWVLPGQN